MKTLFVTVGTTRFDELVKTVCSSDIIKVLEALNFSKITVQVGNGDYKPSKDSSACSSIVVEYFTFKPSITDDIKSADMVISHSGAGSILETLRENKPLIVVVNENLMDNHQKELASVLEDNRYLISCTTRELGLALSKWNTDEFRRFPQHEPEKFTSFLNVALGLA